MKFSVALVLIFPFLIVSCNNVRIKEKPEWGKIFDKHGINPNTACFELNDHNHESVYYYNLNICKSRVSPASTFKIFNSLVALETAIAPDDQMVIPWDKISRNPVWDTDLSMRDAFKVSCVPYYQELARRIGKDKMKFFIDSVRYGNMNISGYIDSFWLNDSLRITADEQVGFLKKLYFNELPFSERTQKIVKTMMLQEQTPKYNLYYKTGTAKQEKKAIYWIVGFLEKIEKIKEMKESMNKSDIRYYPYFFAGNFEIAENYPAKDWNQIRKNALKDFLNEYGLLELP